MGSTITQFTDLADRLEQLPGTYRIVAVDGPGGAGKTTFADRLVASVPGPTTLLRTDNFARPDQLTAWWPRLRTVVGQLAAGRSAAFEPYDWATMQLMPQQVVEPTSLVIVEGVSSSRSEWVEHLAFGIWVEASPQVCRQRAIERDGVDPHEWDRDAAAEAAFFVSDGAKTRADLIVDTETTIDHDPEISFVVRS